MGKNNSNKRLQPAAVLQVLHGLLLFVLMKQSTQAKSAMKRLDYLYFIDSYALNRFFQSELVENYVA